ncbi:MAG: hypothetical protein LPL29_08695 [Alphaproteobacteria bacterium]|nr:hypothetical protein [Alphaproteobacteria bacterium]MDX5369444.1 hypothetical protein [Alphaproteobacteria bacterium]
MVGLTDRDAGTGAETFSPDTPDTFSIDFELQTSPSATAGTPAEAESIAPDEPMLIASAESGNTPPTHPSQTKGVTIYDREGETWAASQNQARGLNARNAAGDPSRAPVAVPVPYDDGSGQQPAVYVGQPVQVADQVAGDMKAGRVPEGFDLAGSAAQAGVPDWDARIDAFANRRATEIEWQNPTSMLNGRVGVAPDRETAIRYAVQQNAANRDDGQVVLPVPLNLTVQGQHFQATGTAQTMMAGDPLGVQTVYREMERQGRIPDGTTFQGVLADAGVSGSWDARLAEASGTPAAPATGDGPAISDLALIDPVTGELPPDPRAALQNVYTDPSTVRLTALPEGYVFPEPDNSPANPALRFAAGFAHQTASNVAELGRLGGGLLDMAMTGLGAAGSPGVDGSLSARGLVDNGVVPVDSGLQGAAQSYQAQIDYTYGGPDGAWMQSQEFGDGAMTQRVGDLALLTMPAAAATAGAAGRNVGFIDDALDASLVNGIDDVELLPRGTSQSAGIPRPQTGPTANLSVLDDAGGALPPRGQSGTQSGLNALGDAPPPPDIGLQSARPQAAANGNTLFPEQLPLPDDIRASQPPGGSSAIVPADRTVGVTYTDNGVPLTQSGPVRVHDGVDAHLVDQARVSTFQNVNPKTGSSETRFVVNGGFRGMSDDIQRQVVDALPQWNPRTYSGKSAEEITGLLDQPGREVFVVTNANGDVGGMASLTRTSALMTDGSTGYVSYLGQVAGGRNVPGAGTQATRAAVEAALERGDHVVAYTTGAENVIERGIYSPQSAMGRAPDWVMLSDPNAVHGGPFPLLDDAGNPIIHPKTGEPVMVPVQNGGGGSQTKLIFGYAPDGATSVPVNFDVPGQNQSLPGIGTSFPDPMNPPDFNPYQSNADTLFGGDGTPPSGPGGGSGGPSSYTGPDGLTYSVGETGYPATGQRPGPLGFDGLTYSDVSQGVGDLPQISDLAYRNINGVGAAAYRQHIAKPIDNFVTNQVLQPLAQTPVGQAVGQAADTLSAQWNAATSAAGRTPVGQAATSAYNATLGNDGFWEGIATANGHAQKSIKAAGAATVATLAIAAENGTLVQGIATAGDPNAPAEAQAVRRALNIPKGLDFQYFYAEIPGVPGGRALAGFGVGEGVALPPSLGPGQPGAQPWIGPSTERRQLTATSTAVATGPIAQFGWSFGTTNYNMSQSANATLGRAGVNVPRVDAGPGAGGASLSALAAVDIASFGYATVVNAGPGAVLIGRDRDPVSPKVAIGTSQFNIDPTVEGRTSAIYPVFSFNTGYNPDAPDAQALGNAWNGIVDGGRKLYQDLEDWATGGGN